MDRKWLRQHTVSWLIGHFDVVDTSRPCQDVLTSAECAALAHQLSKTIDASLATAPAAERDGFRQGAGLLGVPPDDCVFTP